MTRPADPPFGVATIDGNAELPCVLTLPSSVVLPSRDVGRASMARRGKRGSTLTPLPSLIAEKQPEVQLATGKC
jgi:hypothetical protein